MTPPRWRSAVACFCLRASCSRSWRFCSARLRSSPLPCGASPRRGARSGRAWARPGSPGSASGAPAAIPASTASISAMSPETGTWVSCCARDSLASGSASERLRSCASRARRSALRCARLFRHRWLPGLLVRRVVAAPAAELAQLDAVRRVAPRLVRLVVAPLAFFASQRHRDADISASHVSSFTYGRPFTKENPGPKREAGRRIAVRRGRAMQPGTGGWLRGRGSWR